MTITKNDISNIKNMLPTTQHNNNTDPLVKVENPNLDALGKRDS